MFESWAVCLLVAVAVGVGTYHVATGSAIAQSLAFGAVLVANTAMQYDCAHHVAWSSGVMPQWLTSAACNATLGCMACRLVAAIIPWRPPTIARLRNARALPWMSKAGAES